MDGARRGWAREVTPRTGCGQQSSKTGTPGPPAPPQGQTERPGAPRSCTEPCRAGSRTTIHSCSPPGPRSCSSSRRPGRRRPLPRRGPGRSRRRTRSCTASSLRPPGTARGTVGSTSRPRPAPSSPHRRTGPCCGPAGSWTAAWSRSTTGTASDRASSRCSRSSCGARSSGAARRSPGWRWAARTPRGCCISARATRPATSRRCGSSAGWSGPCCCHSADQPAGSSSTARGCASR